MISAMNLAVWSLIVGTLLISMMLASTLLGRLPLSSAMVYLALGWVLGPAAMDVLRPDPLREANVLQPVAEVALLISLFAVGLQLGVPLRDRRWWLPLRLAFLSMAAMVAMVTAIGVCVLDLSLGAAIVLGAVLAPTDPVLASGLHSEPGAQPDRVRFSLAGEGGLNDGTAFPFVMLGLGLLGLHDLGPGFVRWWGIDLLWATAGGVAIGAALGTATGRLVVHLRSRHDEAVGLDEFLGLGLVGMAYGVAQLSLASGFLAVFAAGLALQRVRQQPRAAHPSAAQSADHASDMRDSVQAFNEQLEKLAELALVLLVGAMLPYAAPMPAAWWFVPLALLVLRPLATLVSLPRGGLAAPQQAMIAWFGIRGIGSVFYLLLVLRHGVEPAFAGTLVTLTLSTVAASIVAHGMTAQPLMRLYTRWRRRS